MKPKAHRSIHKAANAVAALLGFLAAQESSLAAANPGEEANRLTQDIRLNHESFEEWRTLIMPSPDELRWQKIAWLPTFSDGLIQADARQMPLLLWVMNGHPMGCT